MDGFTIQLTVDGADGLVHADAAAVMQHISQQLAQRMAETTHAAVAPKVAVDTGRLLGSGEVTLTPDGATLTFTTPYAADVELGTPPHVVPIAELQGWADRHSIPAALVARAIAEHGTRAQPYMTPGLQQAQGGFDALAQNAAAHLGGALIGGGP